MDENEIREAIVETLKNLYLKGMITPTAGNISVRLSNDRIIITPSGYLKFNLKPNDLSVVDINANHISGPKPSSEVKMHLAIYRVCKDCNAIVHIHGLLAPFLDLSYLVNDTEFQYVLNPKHCMVDVIKPGSEELAKAVSEKFAEGCNVVIMKNHGIVAGGRSLEVALELAESTEVSMRRGFMLKKGGILTNL